MYLIKPVKMHVNVYYVHGPLLNSNYDILFKREFEKKK